MVYILFLQIHFAVSSKLDVIYVYGDMEHLEILLCVIVHHNQNKITASKIKQYFTIKYNLKIRRNVKWYSLQQNPETSDQ